MLIFKRYHPLAVHGGWVVCDGLIQQRDHSKNEPAKDAFDKIYATHKEADAKCAMLNKEYEKETKANVS